MYGSGTRSSSKSLLTLTEYLELEGQQSNKGKGGLGAACLESGARVVCSCIGQELFSRGVQQGQQNFKAHSRSAGFSS